MRVAVEKLDGVERAEVSLNEGTVRVALTTDNRITMAQLRTAIRAQGFTPRAATLTLSARVERTDDGFRAIAGPTGASYTLVAGPSITVLLAHSVGNTVVLEGEVPQDVDDVTPDGLNVTRIVRAGEPRVPQWDP